MLLKFFSRRRIFPFNFSQGLVVVRATIEGPNGIYAARLALDTGASGTVLSTDLLRGAGYDLSAATDFVSMTTGSGVERVPHLPIVKLTSLGQEQNNFSVVAHTTPPPAVVDGLLGLDFFRLQVLTLDFRKGEIFLH